MYLRCSVASVTGGILGGELPGTSSTNRTPVDAGAAPPVRDCASLPSPPAKAGVKELRSRKQKTFLAGLIISEAAE